MTGGNKGIGFETAKKLCKELKNENALVVITSRCPDRGKEAVAKLAEEGLKVSMEQLDITDEQSRKQFVEAIKTKHGQVECLVNNAGFAFKRAATEPVATQAKVTCGVNYYGTRDLTMALCPLLKSCSRIVNVASVSGQRSLAQMSAEHRHRLMKKTATTEDIDAVVKEYLEACEKGTLNGWPSTTYGFSKAAEIALTAAWARMKKCSCAPEASEVIVTCCCPGWCKTDMGGWEDPPHTAADGANVIARLALGAGKEHHGKFISENAIIDLSED